jgi:REP element-mobilizing transposase RayT
LVRFGKPTKTLERRELAELSSVELASRDAAKESLMYPAVSLSGLQALSIANGFASHCLKNNYTVWACAILPEHTHLVIARHTFKVEQMTNLLKGAATRRIIEDARHPLQSYATPGQRPPQMWATHLWKVYLDSESAIEQAIAYVRENPNKEGKPVQNWSFVTPFAGIPTGCWVTYH